MHNQADWLIDWIFRSPTHDEFLKVVVEIFFVKWRRSDRVEGTVRVPARLTSIVFSRGRVVEGETGDFEGFIRLILVPGYSQRVNDARCPAMTWLEKVCYRAEL